MKTKDIFLVVLIILLLALGLYTSTLYNNQKKALESFSVEGDNFQIESVSILRDEYIDAMMELEADDILNSLQNDGIEEATTLEELETELNKIDEFNILDDIKKCRIMKRWLRRQKCKTKRNIYQGVVSKTKIGGIGYSDGKIAINAPQIHKFKDEIYRINVLMETYYNLRSSFCDSKGFCHTNALLLACISSTNASINKAYDKCAELYTGEIETKFIKTLELLFENIEKFNDKKITEAQVKSIAETSMEEINQDLNIAAKQQEKDENKNVSDTENTEQE